MFPKSLIIISIVFLLAAWFFLVEKQSFWEKLFILIVLAILYVAFRIFSGASLWQIYFPIKQFFAH